METFEQDIAYFLNRTNSKKPLKSFVGQRYGPSSVYKSSQTTDMSYKTYYHSISPHIMENIRKLYDTDFRLYEYMFDLDELRGTPYATVL